MGICFGRRTRLRLAHNDDLFFTDMGNAEYRTHGHCFGFWLFSESFKIVETEFWDDLLVIGLLYNCNERRPRNGIAVQKDGD